MNGMDMSKYRLVGVKYISLALTTTMSDRARDEARDAYMADVNRAIAGSLGIDIKKRLYDILNPAPVDNRSGMEIAHDILGRMGIVVVESVVK